MQFAIAHALRWSISSGDNDLSPDVQILVRIDVPGLDYPAVTRINQRPFRTSTREHGQVVDTKSQLLSPDFNGSAFWIDLVLNKDNLLKVGSVIAGRLQTPLRKIGGDELGSVVEAARGRVPAFHLVCRTNG